MGAGCLDPFEQLSCTYTCNKPGWLLVVVFKIIPTKYFVGTTYTYRHTSSFVAFITCTIPLILFSPLFCIFPHIVVLRITLILPCSVILSSTRQRKPNPEEPLLSSFDFITSFVRSSCPLCLGCSLPFTNLSLTGPKQEPSTQSLKS